MADDDKKPDEKPPEGDEQENKPEAPAADNQDEDLEHEVTHSDELTADVEVHKVTGSQRRLWFMVLLGVVAISIGGFFLFRTLEGSPSGDGQPQYVQRTEEVEETPQVDYVYSANSSSGEVQSFNTTDNNVESVSGVSGDEMQISSNGRVRAIKNGPSSLAIQGASEEDVTISVPGLSEWVLLPDGTSIYVLSSGDLHRYDSSSGEGGEVAAGFAPTGSNVSSLYVARDGAARMYAKSGEELVEAVYRPGAEEAELRELTLTRLDQVDNFAPNSMSPDGASLVMTATINGNNTLQLISLNSFVMRTIYVSEVPGGFPVSWGWSDDSNNLAINVSGNGTARLVNLKVGTLEKTVVLEQSASGSRFDQLDWSSDKTRVSYVQDSNLKIVNLETSEITDAISGVGEGSVTGWYRN